MVSLVMVALLICTSSLQNVVVGTTSRLLEATDADRGSTHGVVRFNGSYMGELFSLLSFIHIGYGTEGAVGAVSPYF